MLITAFASAAEREDRWRLSEDGDRLSLYIANTDEGTDHIGSHWFECSRWSGKVMFGAHMNEREREAFADLIMRDTDPYIELIPPTPNESSPGIIAHSAMYGWYYSFVMSVDAPAFTNFTGTGTIEFKVGEFVLRREFAVGLDRAVEFQGACRKRSQR
jgi:hypothetical protein